MSNPEIDALIRACQRDLDGGPGLTPNELGSIMSQLNCLRTTDCLLRTTRTAVEQRIKAHPGKYETSRYGVWGVRQLTAMGKIVLTITDALSQHERQPTILNGESTDGY